MPEKKAERPEGQMRRRPMRRRKKVCAFCADANKAQRVYTTDVVVDDQEFAESKASAASSEAAYTPSRSNPAAPAGDGFMNIPDGVEDEGLPFN